MKSLRKSVNCVLLALALAGSGCTPAGKGKPTEARATGVPVSVALVTNVAWDRVVSIVGTLYAKDTATIAAQVEGTVERTLVDFGDRVRSNQDLAFIDTATYEALLAQQSGMTARAGAGLTNALQNYGRVEKLTTASISSEADRDQASAALAQAQAELKAAQGTEAIARLNLEHSRVVAPFDGGISQRIVGRGDYVKIGSPLFEIVNDSVLKFIFQVPERYASFVEKKLPVSFNVDNYPGETFTGGVYLISPSVLAATRAFNVGALVTNTNFRLKASTFARGEMVLERGVPTPTVPVDSVVSFAGVTKVFTVEDGKAHSKTVKLGRIRDGIQEVLEGVHEGEKVIVSGQSKLFEGSAVSLVASGDGKESTKTSQADGEVKSGGSHGGR